MIQATVNPYPSLATKYSAGLDYIINHLPGTPTVDDLVSTVLAYIQSISWFGSTPGSLPPEISSVAYSAINSYVNGQVWSMYNGTQRAFVSDLIGPAFIDNSTIDTVKDNILDIEDGIPRKGMSIETQTPLFFATIMGRMSYDYWLYAINSAAMVIPSPWLTYLDTALTSATANLPFYIAAGMEGALIGARSTPRGMIAPTTNVVSNEIIGALIGALTVGAGKVIFKWVPSFQESLANDTDRQKFYEFATELTERINSRGIGVKEVERAIEDDNLNKVCSLLGYTKSELIQRTATAALSNAVSNLKSKNAIISDFLYKPEHHHNLGEIHYDYNKPDCTASTVGNLCTKCTTAFNDCRKCFGEHCNDDPVCALTCVKVFCELGWQLICWLFGPNALNPSNGGFTKRPQDQE